MLSNTFSGAAGEQRVAAEFVRYRVLVAKPYWTHDEVDLLILHPQDGAMLPIPIQVKSLQFLSSNSRPVEGLKKRYVERSPALCLAIYRPDTDRIYFIDGAENIRKVYKAQKSKRKYEDLKDDEEVQIRVKYQNSPLDREWLAPLHDAKWLLHRVERVAKMLADEGREKQQLEILVEQSLADVEEDEEQVEL